MLVSYFKLKMFPKLQKFNKFKFCQNLKDFKSVNSPNNREKYSELVDRIILQFN